MHAWAVAIAAITFDVGKHSRLVPRPRARPPIACSPVERRRTLSRLQYAAGIITDDKRASIVTLDEEIDLHNATMSFDFLCRAADYDDAREDVSMDIDDFQMAFEQLYCGGDPLEEDVAVELMAAVNEMGWRADVTLSEWNRFHAMWAEATTAPAYIEAILERKKADSAAGYERMRRDTIEKELQEKLDEAVAAQAEAVAQPAAATPEPAAAVPASNSSSKLVRDTAAAMVAVGSKLVGDKPTAEKPTLLASYSAKTAAKKAASSEPSTAAVARYRSLDLAAWSRVVDDVGGLTAHLGAAVRAALTARRARRRARQGAAAPRPAWLWQVVPRGAPRDRPLATPADDRQRPGGHGQVHRQLGGRPARALRTGAAGARRVNMLG